MGSSGSRFDQQALHPNSLSTRAPTRSAMKPAPMPTSNASKAGQSTVLSARGETAEWKTPDSVASPACAMMSVTHRTERGVHTDE